MEEQKTKNGEDSGEGGGKLGIYIELYFSGQFCSSIKWILPWRSSIGLSRVLSASEPTSVHTSMEKLGFIQHLSVNNKDGLPLRGSLPCPGKGPGSFYETMSHAV